MYLSFPLESVAHPIQFNSNPMPIPFHNIRYTIYHTNHSHSTYKFSNSKSIVGDVDVTLVLFILRIAYISSFSVWYNNMYNRIAFVGNDLMCKMILYVQQHSIYTQNTISVHNGLYTDVHVIIFGIMIWDCNHYTHIHN